MFAKKGRNCIGLEEESWRIHLLDMVRSVILVKITAIPGCGNANRSFERKRCWLRTILNCLAWDWIYTRTHDGQGRWWWCHNVRHSHLSTMATRIKGQSEKEREGHSDNDWTVSFLCLPFLILGGGAVEYGVLHDDTVVDKWWIYFIVLNLTVDKIDFM